MPLRWNRSINLALWIRAILQAQSHTLQQIGIRFAWQQAEIEAANGKLTKPRAAEILKETLRRIGSAAPLERAELFSRPGAGIQRSFSTPD